MKKGGKELRNIVEAALLVAGQPLTLEKLLSLFPEDSRPSRDQLRAVLKELQEACAGRWDRAQADRARLALPDPAGSTPSG